MLENIKNIFIDNVKLIGLIDKAIYYLRIQEYEPALDIVSETAESITTLADAIIRDRDYFSLVSTDSVAEMIQGIINAKRKKDYVLLADLFEMQLLNFASSVQELIMKREDYLAFDEELYSDNIRRIKISAEKSLRELTDDITDDEIDRLCVNQGAVMDEELDPAYLLDSGFFVEYSSCGCMTLGATDKDGEKYYFHSNNKIGLEAFLLARHWFDKDIDRYVIYGFGMGYHICELLAMSNDISIVVFESDIRVLKLAAAFSDIGKLLADERISIVYDPDSTLIDRYLKEKGSTDLKICLHLPSLRNIRDDKKRIHIMELGT